MSEVVPAHGGARTDSGSSETPCIYCPHEVTYIIYKKARWAKELEAKYAHEFPVSKPPGAA